MTLKQWLKKIYLFPFSIVMAVPDGDATDPADSRPLGERIMALAGNPNAQFMTETQDAAASEDDADDADHQGNPGDEADEGLDTQSDEDDQDADPDEVDEADETTSQETDESEEGQKGTKKRTLDERAAEIAEKIVNEKLAALQTSQSAEVPDFAPPETVNKVKLNIVKQQARIREIEADLDLDGDDVDQAKVDELLQLQDFVNEARAALKENDRRQKAWEAKQSAKKQQTDNGDALRKELDETAELFRQEMKIEPAVWKKMGEWFEAQLPSKPLVVAEFNDIFQRQGKVAAIRYAHEYTLKHMGQGTKQAIEKKEQLKTKTASLTTTQTGKAKAPDLRKIQAEFAANPTDDNFVRLQAAKRQAKAG